MAEGVAYTGDTSDLVKQSFTLWGQERAEAAKISDPSKRAAAMQKADQRVLTSMQNGGVNKSVIESFAKFVGSIQENEGAAVAAVLDATKKRIEKLQALQQEQAAMMMKMYAQPEQAKAGIASFATTISTILRFFGADDMAEKIEQKAKQIMDTIQVKIPDDKIRNTKVDQGMLEQAIVDMGVMYRSSTAPARSAERANQGPSGLPDITAPQVGSPKPGQDGRGVTSSAVSWNVYRDAFKDVGLSAAEIKGITSTWLKAATVSGNPATLDTAEDVAKFTSSPAVLALTADKQSKVGQVVRQLTPMGSQTETR
jgi:hypothetical protein